MFFFYKSSVFLEGLASNNGSGGLKNFNSGRSVFGDMTRYDW